MVTTLRGAGGGKGGGGSFVQKPDNLRSNDTFEGLLGLCAGPIKGPVRGMKSIRVNGTPIEGEDGTENFPGFLAVFADGDPLKFPQKATLKLGAAGAPVAIGTDISNTNPSGTPGDWVARTLTNTGAQAIDLRFIVNQLYKQTKKGVFENILHLEIEMKPAGTATWINPFNANGNPYPAYSEDGYQTGGKSDSIVVKVFGSAAGYVRSDPAMAGSTLTIKGKTTSPYVKELRIAVPSTGDYADRSWDVRVRLVEPESVDDDPNFEKRMVAWESMAAVYSGDLGDHEDWRALAWLQLYGKASDNFNGLPAIDGIYETKIVQVPPAAVFDPDTRIYSGVTWDGSWEKAFTTDPAWIINDAISDSISGIAALVPGAHLNKWDALELSKWCSEQVPDGAGGFHPRFALNIAVDQAQRSDELVRFLAGACGSTTWDNGEGEWRCVVDKPQTPVAVFTDENIEGLFSYSHTDVDTRFNEVTVVFLNEEFDYREDWLKVSNNTDIAKNGRKPTRLVTVGCTNRQQALRWAVLRIRTNINEFRLVNFVTNRQGKYIERFNHILVADNSLNNMADDTIKRTTGRLIYNNGTTVRVRDPLRLEIGVNYALRVTVPNPEYSPEPTGEPSGLWSQPTTTVTRNILNAADARGDVTELLLESPLPADVAENANVALEAIGLPAIPRTYRVLDVDYNADGERVTISAIEVDTGKWSAADSATDADLQTLFNDVIPPPTAPAGGMFTLNSFVAEFGIKQMLIANWDRPDSILFDKYRLEYRFNQGPWQDLGYQRDDFWELVNPPSGRHDLRVYAVARRGFESLPVEGTLAVEDLPSSLVIGFGPTALVANYDYTGATPQDLPKEQLYNLSANGVAVLDATWDYRVVDGNVNGFTPSSGWQAMTVDSGMGLFPLTAVDVNNSQVELRGTANGVSTSTTLSIEKKLAAPPPTDPASAIQTGGFGHIGTPFTSFVPITDELTIDVPSGKTATEVVVNLNVTMPKGADNLGPWDVEYKLQRDVGGVWTDVGGVQNSNPDPFTQEEIRPDPGDGAIP